MTDHHPRTAALINAAATLHVVVSPPQADRLLRFLDAVLAENRHVNLTAIRDPDQAFVLHAVDSLAAGMLQPEAPRRALDIGTGNGFPGIAIATLWPDSHVVLSDRTHKKVHAIARALTVAGAGDQVEVLAIDVEQARRLRPEWRRAFDLVVSRAVAAPAAIAALAAPLLAPGGRLLLWLDQATKPPARVTGYLAEATAEYDLPEPAVRTRVLASYRRITS